MCMIDCKKLFIIVDLYYKYSVDVDLVPNHLNIGMFPLHLFFYIIFHSLHNPVHTNSRSLTSEALKDVDRDPNQNQNLKINFTYLSKTLAYFFDFNSFHIHYWCVYSTRHILYSIKHQHL